MSCNNSLFFIGVTDSNKTTFQFSIKICLDGIFSTTKNCFLHDSFFQMNDFPPICKKQVKF